MGPNPLLEWLCIGRRCLHCPVLVCALMGSLLVPRLWHRPWGCEVDVAALNLFGGVLCEVSEVPAHTV
jgi:hypothetical protein